MQTCAEKKFDLTYYEQLRIGQQLAEGLAFMAAKRYIHMDIAARNCLIGDNNNVKVADFGLVKGDGGGGVGGMAELQRQPIPT